MRSAVLLASVLLRTPLLAQIAVSHVTVIDVARGQTRPDMTVVIAGNRIRSVDRRAVQPGVQVIDGHGKFLIPGLWDMHDHALSDIRSG